MLKSIEKRFPSTLAKEKDTIVFLNDPKVDGELYAYYQKCATVIPTNETHPFTHKKVCNTILDMGKLPLNGKEIAAMLGYSPKTLQRHRQYLIDMGYLQSIEGKKYLMTNMENNYLLIPQRTLEFLMNVVQEHVIKTYLFLGAKYRSAKNGEEVLFTLEELGRQTGISVKGHSEAYQKIKDCLLALEKLGLIKYCVYQEDAIIVRHKLLEFNLVVPEETKEKSKSFTF